MPRTRRTTKKPTYGKKRTYRRKRRVKRTPIPIGVPQKMFCKMRYTDMRQLTILGGVQDLRQWRMNNLFDPDYTGSGGQPYYYDQYINMFQRYKVYGVLIEWRVTSVISASGFQPLMYIVPTIGSVSWGTDYTTALEKKGALWRNPMSGQQGTYMKKYYSIANILGVSKKQYNDDSVYDGENAATPPTLANTPLLNLVVVNMDALASISFTSWVRLTYYTKWFRPQQPGGS